MSVFGRTIIPTATGGADHAKRGGESAPVGRAGHFGGAGLHAAESRLTGCCGGVLGSGVPQVMVRFLTARPVVDLVLVVVAFVLAWAVRSLVLPKLLPAVFETALYPLSGYLRILPVVLIAWAFGLWVASYRAGEAGGFLSSAGRIVAACFAASFLVALICRFSVLDEKLIGGAFSRFLLLTMACLSALFLILERSLRSGRAKEFAFLSWDRFDAAAARLARPLARFWPVDGVSLVFLFLATANFLLLSALLCYEDPVLDFALMIGDAQDWVANGLYFLGHPVAYSARPPLFPLVLAGLASVSMLKLVPLVLQGLVFVTGLGLYRMLSETSDRFLTALATLAWLTNATWVWWSATWMADIPAGCLLGWALIFWQRRNSAGRPGYALAGLAAGLSAVTQPIAVLFAIPVLATVIWHRRADLRSQAFLIGATLFLTPGIIWILVRMRLVGTLGDVVYRNWGAVGLQAGSLHSNGSFYAWSLVALVGIPAVFPIAVGMWTTARRSIRSDWATLVIGGFLTIMAFFVLVYNSSSARFLSYVYPFLLIFLVFGLCRIRRSSVAVVLSMLIVVWGLPLRVEMMKWPRIVLWPFPLVDLKMAAQNVDGIWTLLPAVERIRYEAALERNPYILLKRIRELEKPPRLEGVSFESDRHAVYFAESGDYHHRLYHQTRLGNQLRMKVYQVPFTLVARSWPLMPAKRLGLQDAVVLYRVRLPGEPHSSLIALDPGGEAEERLAGPAGPQPGIERDLDIARRIAALVKGSRLLVLCGHEGAERWQASLPFTVDVLDLWYVGAWGLAEMRSKLGPEERREVFGDIVVGLHRIDDLSWWVIGARELVPPQKSLEVSNPAKER